MEPAEWITTTIKQCRLCAAYYPVLPVGDNGLCPSCRSKPLCKECGEPYTPAPHLNEGLCIGCKIDKHTEMFKRMTDQKPKLADAINPPHYRYSSIEVYEMMIRIWGVEKFIAYCEINAFKYRMRAGRKNDAAEDLKKAMWYEEKAEQYREKL